VTIGRLFTRPAGQVPAAAFERHSSRGRHTHYRVIRAIIRQARPATAESQPLGHQLSQPWGGDAVAGVGSGSQLIDVATPLQQVG
jgi:hypothetical protein